MTVAERLAALSNDTRDRIELLQVLIIQGQRANHNPGTAGALQLRANLLALQALLPQLYEGWTGPPCSGGSSRADKTPTASGLLIG
jgi:hypothetical protein